MGDKARYLVKLSEETIQLATFPVIHASKYRLWAPCRVRASKRKRNEGEIFLANTEPLFLSLFLSSLFSLSLSYGPSFNTRAPCPTRTHTHTPRRRVLPQPALTCKGCNRQS